MQPNPNLPNRHQLESIHRDIRSLLKTKKSEIEILQHLREEFDLTREQAEAATQEFDSLKYAAALRTAKMFLLADAVGLLVVFALWLTGTEFTFSPALVIAVAPFGLMFGFLLWITVSTQPEFLSTKGSPSQFKRTAVKNTPLASIVLLAVVFIAGASGAIDDAPDQTSQAFANNQVFFWVESDVRPVGETTTRLTGTVQNTSERWTVVDLVIDVEFLRAGIADRESAEVKLDSFNVPPGETRSYSQEFSSPENTRTIQQQMRWEWDRN